MAVEWMLTLRQCVGFLTDYPVIHCSPCNQGTCIKCQKLKSVSLLSVNFIPLSRFWVMWMWMRMTLPQWESLNRKLFCCWCLNPASLNRHHLRPSHTHKYMFWGYLFCFVSGIMMKIASHCRPLAWWIGASVFLSTLHYSGTFSNKQMHFYV